MIRVSTLSKWMRKEIEHHVHSFTETSNYGQRRDGYDNVRTRVACAPMFSIHINHRLFHPSIELFTHRRSDSPHHRQRIDHTVTILVWTCRKIITKVYRSGWDVRSPVFLVNWVIESGSSHSQNTYQHFKQNQWPHRFKARPSLLLLVPVLCNISEWYSDTSRLKSWHYVLQQHGQVSFLSRTDFTVTISSTSSCSLLHEVISSISLQTRWKYSYVPVFEREARVKSS